VKGTVIKSTGNWYVVMTEDGRKINCRIKGSLRLEDYKSTNPIVVGDHVTISFERDGNGIIIAVGERKNCIIRKSKNLSKQSHILAVNIDLALLIVTLAIPKTSLGFIDRFLATAEAYRIPAKLIFNKADIFEEDEFLKEELYKTMNIYENIGYSSYSICSLNMKKEVREKMLALLKNKITLLCGPSGTGKSTFINAIEPSLNLKTGEISSVHLQGKHTTTFTEMHPLSFGGYVIDTPGIKEFSVINMDKNEVYHFFPEIFQKAKRCKYPNCLHLNEPQCAVIKAVEKNEIAPSRYHSYMSIMMGEEVKKEY
jgi:ribosome biogenesis GTPase